MSVAVPLVIVGYGRRGRQWRQTCRERSDVEVVAVVEPDPAARAAAGAAGLPVFDSTDAAAAATAAVAAIVASPLESHAAVARDCLATGLAVLVEKPLALSVADAASVVEEAARRNLPSLVVQNFRFLRRERAVVRTLAEGAIGRPRSADVDSARAVRSSDALWDFAIHHFDAYRVRYGGPPATVTARPSSILDVVLTWPDGLEVRYRHDDAASGYRYREHLVGADGALTVDDQHVSLERDRRRRARTVRATRHVDPDDAVLDELLHALAGGQSTLAASDNILTVAMVAAVAEAVREGGTVRVGDG